MGRWLEELGLDRVDGLLDALLAMADTVPKLGALSEEATASGMLALRMMDENFLKKNAHMCDAKLPVYSLRGGPWWCELRGGGERQGVFPCVDAVRPGGGYPGGAVCR